MESVRFEFTKKIDSIPKADKYDSAIDAVRAKKQEQQNEKIRFNFTKKIDTVPNNISPFDRITQMGKDYFKNQQQTEDLLTRIPSVNYNEDYAKVKNISDSDIVDYFLGTQYPSEKKRLEDEKAAIESGLRQFASEGVTQIAENARIPGARFESDRINRNNAETMREVNRINGELEALNKIITAKAAEKSNKELLTLYNNYISLSDRNDLKEQAEKEIEKQRASSQKTSNPLALQKQKEADFIERLNPVRNVKQAVINQNTRKQISENAANAASVIPFFEDYEENSQGPEISLPFSSVMSDEEKGIFNYIKNTSGDEAAKRYYNDLSKTYLEDRFFEKQSEEAFDYAKSRPVLSSAGSVFTNLYGAAEQGSNMLMYLFSGGEYEIPKSWGAEMSGQLRAGVSDKFDWKIKDWDAFDFVYNTVMSGIDSATAFALSGGVPGVGAGLLGLSAAASATNDIIERGGTNEQAFLGGLAAGTFETLFEKISLGNLKALKEIPAGDFKDTLKNMAKSMLVNASEESLTEIANIAYDTFVNADISQYKQMLEEYMKSGFTEAEARKKAAQSFALQVLEAGAGGALMGVGFAGISSVRTARSSSKAKRSEGSYIKRTAAASQADVKDIAEYYKSAAGNKDTEEAKALKKSADKVLNGDTSDFAVGDMLYNAQNYSESVRKNGVYKVVGSAVKSQNNGITGALRMYEELSDGGAELSEEAQRLYSQINAVREEVSDISLGKFMLELYAANPQALPTADTVKTAEDITAQQTVDSAGDEGYNDVRGDMDVRSENAEVLADGGISAVGRSGNGIRQQSENTEKIKRILGRVSKKQGKSDSNIQAGDSGWAVRPGQEKADRNRFKESVRGKLHKGSISSTDTAGRTLNDKVKKDFNNSVLKDKTGRILSFFHWTQEPFEIFKKGDVGFHFGTLDSASDRLNDMSESGKENYIKEVYINITNPLIFETEIGTWDVCFVATVAFDNGILNENEIQHLEELNGFFDSKYDDEASVELRRILNEKGYDGILYKNQYEDIGSVSVIAFNPDQILTVAENGILKENSGVSESYSDEADRNGSAFSSDENTEVNEDKEDTAKDTYAKEESFWTAENKNLETDKTLTEKIRLLFSDRKSNQKEKPVSIVEIVKLIEKKFGIPVSTGKFRQKAYGIYKIKSEAIRTKITNALPTIAHEVGHHLDKKYHLQRFKSIKEAIQVMKEARPDFYKAYPPEQRPGEAVAEFIRNYLADRNLAQRNFPAFYSEFESVLRENGSEDLKNLNIIGDKINEYFTAEKTDRARAAIISRQEARRINRKNKKISHDVEGFLTSYVDEATPLKKISAKAYDLFYYAKKSSVRAKNALVGEYMPSFSGKGSGLVEMRDKDGNVVKGKDGKAQYVTSLKHVLSDIDEQSMPDFEAYLVYKHGLEFLENGKRVFADDSINNSQFMKSEISRLEKAHPQFKETAENLYSWYDTFLYEWGVKSGLFSKDQYKILTETYPCYVPFMRNTEGANEGVRRGVANQRAPIRRAKGSGLEILSPLESISIKVEQFMKAADRNAVMQEVAQQAEDVEGLGYLLERVPPDMVPVTVSTDGIRKNIEDWYKEQSESNAVPDDFIDQIDEIIGDTITEFAQSNFQGKNVVWVYKNGKKALYQVHDVNLLTALTGLNTVQFHAVTRAIGSVTRLFKVLTTGGNPVWSLASNTPRDFDAAYKYSAEKNPIKYTLDYIRAVKSAFSQLKGENADEIVKLYKTVGGGYNNSLSSNARTLKTTMKEIVKTDEGLADRIKSFFNFVDLIEKLADFIETTPRLAEFKRVYESTGDTKKALLAAEEITVNFNRSGSKSKAIDQFIPYFNASIQGTNKLITTTAKSIQDRNYTFFAKTIVSGIIKVGLIFAWNILMMDDDDNDEYERLSAYKKNNFYNIYIGDGKFLSIPKSKDTAVFDSLVERVFEMAMKEDVDYKEEISDFAAYLELVFVPPFISDVAIFGTMLELAGNEDFKGTPIVSSYYENLNPEAQYNEKTTYIAKALGQLLGYSPMKIDHIIQSNFGIFGLLNKSLGKSEKDWSLGLGTKVITDNTYSTDILNRFYDNADKYDKQAKSYPDDAEAVYKNKQYQAVRSIISVFNDYGKEDPDSARDYKILARDYADNFEKNAKVDEDLLALLERTGDKDILYDKNFESEFTREKVKYKMAPEDFLNYIDEYYEEIEKEYDRILSMNVNDDATVKMLKNAKNDISDRVSEKYKNLTLSNEK